MDTVQQMWESFVKLAMPPDAPDDQMREMRRAFMAGAHGMFMRCSGLGAASVSEDAGVMRLEMWWIELEQFKADVMAGKA